MSKEYEPFIICPHCNFEHLDMCDYGFEKWNDGEEINFICDSCRKEFEVILGIQHTFSSYKKGESDE